MQSKSILKLFKAVLITEKKGGRQKKSILEKTIKSGFIFSPEVIYNYPEGELLKLVVVIEKELGLTTDQLNNSFHKSWKKVKEANIEQLIIEQILHYITTYGYEDLGIYSEDTIYIPTEKLDVDALGSMKIPLFVIKGYTKEELKDKVLGLLQTGIALGDETKKDMIDACLYVGVSGEDIESIRNKEVRTVFYDYLNLIPRNPIEFLRYVIYKSIGKTLLIKDDATISEIKSKDNFSVLSIFNQYKTLYGLERLAEIFLRFKPIFLALKTNSLLKRHINKIRKLATKYHKPIKPDYLNSITAMIKRNEDIDEKVLLDELEKVNVFRKIRLAYALKFRTMDSKSILYKIRNGKGWATEFEFSEKLITKEIYGIVFSSIVDSIKTKLKGKKIYIPDYIEYSLPATEKQFTGDFPSGTCVRIPNDMIVGIHWDNLPEERVDLDLSLVGIKKFGWDSGYRDEKRSILFSGDMTDAQLPNGATELFYVSRQSEGCYVVFLNFYNMGDVEERVPFQIVVAKEKPKDFKRNYTINPNNIVCMAKSGIDKKQKMLGLLITSAKESKFYFCETNIGKGISSSTRGYAEHSRNYLFNFYQNMIGLKDVLKGAGVKFTDKKDCDIDLSPELLEKDTIINLLFPQK